jgi:hypothetical protein
MTEEHEHIWDKWYPWDRTHKWRKCVLPGCNEKQVEEAKG